MKKYVKPELFYENYELSQYVAGCGVKITLTSADAKSCNGTSESPSFPGLLFTDSPRCGNVIQDYCITNGGGSTVTFGS